MHKLTILTLALIVSACSDTRPFLRETATVKFGRHDDRPNGNEVITFYALGDWGTGDQNQKAVANALRKDVAQLPPGREVMPFVLAPGDNVYEVGLPQGWGEPKVDDLLHQTFGNIYQGIQYGGQDIPFHLVAGNHDHAGKAGGKNGVGDVIHQETTAEKLYPNWRYYPIDPAQNADSNDSTDYAALRQKDIFNLTTPEKVDIGAADNRLAIFALDTQVMLELYQQKNDSTLQRHWQELEKLAAASSAKWKLILGHHPVRSHGTHAGFRSAIWWVPPIIIATLVDKFFVRRLQDFDHPAYRAFTRDLSAFMKEHGIVAYVAGHDHSQQFLAIDNRHFQLIAGSAGKLSAATHKDDTIFSHSSFGFVRMDLTRNELWMEFFEVVPKTGQVSSSAVFLFREN